VSDTEYMAGQLAAYGYTIIEHDAERDSADIWLLNSCTVKDPSQSAFVNLLKAGRERMSPMPMVLAGCVPQVPPSLPPNAPEELTRVAPSRRIETSSPSTDSGMV
jgi:threonylcarbamoyladenosine tRNA methylthiotransferase CDKAL1